MDENTFTVELKCLFCDSPLEGDPEQEFVSGDLIKCQNCKELNDYDALVEVAAEEGLLTAKEQVNAEFQRAFDDIFKK